MAAMQAHDGPSPTGTHGSHPSSAPGPSTAPRDARVPAFDERVDAQAVAAMFAEHTAWSPYHAEDTGDRPASGRLDDEPHGWTPADVAGQRMEVRASDVVRMVLYHSRDYGPQLELLSRSPMSDSFGEFLHMLLDEAVRAGALYARHLDDAVMAGSGRWAGGTDGVMPFRQAVHALAALSGTDLMPEPAAEGKAR